MTIDEKIKVLIEYLKVKLEERDYHGVADCANDLRVLEAQRPLRLHMPLPGGPPVAASTK